MLSAISIYKPPFVISPEILDYCVRISKELGFLSGRRLSMTPLSLRRTNNIKTIQASLSIEGNTLSLDHVTDILEGKPVIGPEKDILEVRNALSTYDHIKKLSFTDIRFIERTPNVDVFSNR
ncbi:MAG: hypothetical protein ACK50V_09370 [Alphaproteobacteria bacterium]|jgi:Fic family protein